MSLKKKLGLGVASAVLGLTLVGGGTYAYFNDTETSTNTFAAGTLDLTLDPEVIFNVDNLKPGDSMKRYFEMQNTGSLDIARVLLDTSYNVSDANDNNGNEDLGEHFVVKFLKNEGHPESWLDNDEYTVVEEISLADLSTMTPDDLAVELEDFLFWDYEEDGIPAGGTDYMAVKIEFVDNDEDQNIFQGDSLELEWQFTAEQEEGERR
ncbi:SipW-cognate class signal peptide [Gracilibacillus orientalis]|uniref:SipW-cognate class signal peptide n=1 Tax=Gracilibacillus orientalis TaxID=334253 RepID=A0A1I4P6V1_9BACI|nr:TasA family protein [Gracilibacillus orientalis]SFM23336.1 SipW-cognate class signal peptide [Gracilibacillus orientalis]